MMRVTTTADAAVWPGSGGSGMLAPGEAGDRRIAGDFEASPSHGSDAARGDSGHGSDSAGGHGHPPARPWSRLRLLLRPERRDILTIVLFAFAVALLQLASPIAIESLVNTVAFGVLLWPVLVISAVLMICLALATTIRALQIAVVEAIQRRLFVRVALDYAARLPRIDRSALDQSYGPELANRFFDVMTLQKSFATLILDGVAIVVTMFVGMSVLAFYHPFLLGFDLALLGLVAFLLFVLGWGGVQTSLEESHAKYDMAAWLEELLRSQRLFKSAHGQQYALDRAHRLTHHYISSRKSHFRVVWRQTVFALGLQVYASTALLSLGGWLVIERQLTLGQLVAAELIVSLVVASVSKLGKYMETYYDLASSAEKLGLLIDLPLERQSGEALLRTQGGMQVRVDRLSSLSHQKLPHALSMELQAGERVAVQVHPGSSKRLLLEALCGYREPDEGVIELDGLDLRDLRTEEVRNQVALVDGPEIVAGSVLDNVRMGRSELTAATVRQVLQLVGLSDFLGGLPDGMSTHLPAGGGWLPNSDAIRLTLARALIGRPRLLILDSVLDLLDVGSSGALLDTLFDREAPWTLLVVTQRPEIMNRCDRQIVLGA